jgi:short subunit dehydrogenase-like uncharacterized protein
MADYLIYGAYGYTGELIAREAVARGQRPMLGGRSAEKLKPLADQLGLRYRAFGLEDPAEVEAALQNVSVLLHCAGPFSHTSRAMVDACLRTQTHYFDITGEVEVFESVATRDAAAQRAGVMLLPGIGFDVVPSDCLAAHLHRRLPSAKRLVLAFQAISRPSRGTATTMVENLHRGGMIRRDGHLTPVPGAWKTRAIDFGEGPIDTMTIPWGDVSTAWHSTGIPNIEVYVAAPRGLRIASRMSRHLGWLLGSETVQKFLKARVQAGPPGPSQRQREAGHSHLWGEVTDDAGRRAISRLHGPEGYRLTTLSALAGVERALSGNAPPGFQTPSKAYGPDFVLELPDVTREDIEIAEHEPAAAG